MKIAIAPSLEWLRTRARRIARPMLTGLGRRGHQRALLALVIALVAVRAALPYALRSTLVSRADLALRGHVELEDLELSLLHGGVTLRGLSVFAHERADDVPDATPAVFTARRLGLEISWLALLTKRIRVEALELEGFSLHLENRRDGLVVPSPVAEAAADPPREAIPVGEDAPDPDPAAGWSFALDGVRFRDGRLSLRDHTPLDGPQELELALQDVTASELHLIVDSQRREQGQLSLRAEIGEGSIELDADVESTPAGPAIDATLELRNLALADTRAYVSAFEWRELTGRVDARIAHRFEPGGRHELAGTLSLADLRVGVPDLDRDALAFEALEIEVESVDLARRAIAVESIALSGLRLPIDPRADLPLPLLTPRAAGGAASSDTPEPAPDSGAGSDETVDPGRTTRPAAAWTWSLGTLALRAGTLELLGAGNPLSVGIELELRDLSDDLSRRSPAILVVSSEPGELRFDGSIAPDPLAVAGSLDVREIELSALLARTLPPELRLLRSATLRADLALELGSAPDAPAPAAGLRASGTVGLSDVAVGDARELFVGWRDLEIAARDVRLPSLPDPRNVSTAPTITLDLDRVRLREPTLRLTRTADGLVLPAFSENASTEPASARDASASEVPPLDGPALAGPEGASAPAPVRQTPELVLRVGEARIEAARAELVDRSVEPDYVARIDPLALRLEGVAWPEQQIEAIDLEVSELNGGRLRLRGKLDADAADLEVQLERLPLTPFNPYIAGTGYALAGGSVSLASDATLRASRYQAPSTLVLSRLELGAATDDQSFLDTFGLPLPLALSLLRDAQGDITLSIPVAGDRGGARIGVLSVAGQALRKALLGALASPLALLGGRIEDGKVAALERTGIEFAPGEASATPAGAERLDEIARILAAAPELSLAVVGSAAPVDARVRAERALLEELEQPEDTLRALGNLTERDERRVALGFLRARRDGRRPPELTPPQLEWLERSLAPRWPEERELRELALSRAERARAVLTAGGAVAARRLEIGVRLDTGGTADVAQQGQTPPTAPSGRVLPSDELAVRGVTIELELRSESSS